MHQKTQKIINESRFLLRKERRISLIFCLVFILMIVGVHYSLHSGKNLLLLLVLGSFIGIGSFLFKSSYKIGRRRVLLQKKMEDIFYDAEKKIENWLPKNKKTKISNGTEEILTEKDKLINVLNQYYLLFSSSYDEDWNRDTPFLDIIESGRCFINSKFEPNFPPYDLESSIRDLPISELERSRLMDSLGEYWDQVSKLPLSRFFFLMSELKSFREGSTQNEKQSPEKFLEDKIMKS